jgi:predicted membrane-bound mannosyltransferase
MLPLPAHARRRTWIVLILSVLMLTALMLRVQAVWQRILKGPNAPALRWVGDEIGNEELAYALLQGAFSHSPVRGPVYPLFIAIAYYSLGERSPAKLLYVQAVVGAAVVPLTYPLARRLTGSIPALVAAGIVACNDPLIEHARWMYSEIISTPLLLVALLTLLWALQAPRRFAWAGASTAVVTLGRPTTALIPLMLPWCCRGTGPRGGKPEPTWRMASQWWRSLRRGPITTGAHLTASSR